MLRLKKHPKNRLTRASLMPTTPLYLEDAYAREANARVQRITDEGGIVLDGSLFYPTSGGQPGDSGALSWGLDGVEGEIAIATTVKGPEGEIILIPAEPVEMPRPGTLVRQQVDWDRRFGHMRVHTALHLLSVVIPLPVKQADRLRFCGEPRVDYRS